MRGGDEERCKRSNGGAVNIREGEDSRPEALLPLCLMMLTDIIEFYKCLKSLSGAAAALSGGKKMKKIKAREKEKEITTRQNIPRGAKRLKKCCGKENKTTLRSPNLKLPAASAQLRSPL